MGEQVGLDLKQYVGLSFSNDKGEAFLQLIKDEEGFVCSPESLEQFLLANGVNFGIQKDALVRFAANPGGYAFTPLRVAIGQPPVSGEDGFIRYALSIDQEQHRPNENEDGSVDYKDVIRLNNLQKGQLIAELVPPVPGKPGRAVTGEEIPCKPGKEARFKVGKNVVLNPEQTAMYAAIDGLVTKTDKGKINVFPIYEVNGDVDYTTGNISFIGTVIVRGNVLTGFRVSAAGDIRVIGGVEGAELEAGGSIEITGGIIGYNKGLVKAGHNVKSSFIQDGNVHAAEDVIVSQSIMHSNIRAGRDVLCNGAKGLIVGGNIQAGEKVTARIIGNPMSTTTTVEVGVLPELRNELADLRLAFKENMGSLDKTDKALAILDQLASVGKLTTEKMQMRAKLSLTKKQHLREQADLKERMLEIEKSLEDTSKAKVQVLKMIYGGSKIVIGRYTKFIKDPVSHMTFYYSEGDISMSSYV
ncbi:FapA family protein [Paenibacillus sp. J22TS3]|uniref:FapA family protein n=1 Tax=Paenibacillus sp. J22TS3 TaxID=2807192 RepID=UPI001B03A212|nr:FapA family protein [Paenibacillus sp. J22TS3]GIP21452.1 polymerase [Paenibacillus sp. J22TS3]